MIEELATAAFVALELHCRSDNNADVSAKGDLRQSEQHGVISFRFY